jgi:hypothetical protein
MDHHFIYIQRCRELAALAAAEGESPVGSLLVKDGVILGELGGTGPRFNLLTADDIAAWGKPPVVTIYPEAPPGSPDF